VPAREDGVESPVDKVDEAATVRGTLTPERRGAANGATVVPAAAAEPTKESARPDGAFQLAPAARPGHVAATRPAAVAIAGPAAGSAIAPEVPTAVAVRVALAQPNVDGQGDGGRPGPAAPAADAAQESESEVDPFSKIEAFVRRDGKVAPQFGREVKTVRPKMLPVSVMDAIMGARTVTLKVRIGPDGKVTGVKVHKSSGSNEVDQPCVVAMYDWWFEPLKDKTGKPVPDTILFTLNFR
jgi:TonB family protein